METLTPWWFKLGVREVCWKDSVVGSCMVPALQIYRDLWYKNRIDEVCEI